MISYDANSQRLHIGDKKFLVKVRPFRKGSPPFSIDITDAKITNIQVSGDNYTLFGKSEKYGKGDPLEIKKTEMSDFILALLRSESIPQKFSEQIEITSV